MTAEAFGLHAEGRRTGNGKWLALCPARAQSLPSLSTGVGSDGRILVHSLAKYEPESEIEDCSRERVRRGRKQP
jgi:hypothetical protein